MKNNFAVIDIGSNSVRMVIYDISATPPRQIYNEKFFTALGRTLDTSGKLDPEGFQIALDGLKTFSLAAREHQASWIDVVGTAALRDARDGSDFIVRAKQETGLTVRIINGDQEARYAALGVAALDPLANGIVADFGGGSLELARIDSSEIHETMSLPFGAFRVLGMKNDAERVIREGLIPLQDIYGGAPTLYTIGGSWRALAQAYHDKRGEKLETLQGYRIEAQAMRSFCHRIMIQSSEEVRRETGMEEKRAVHAPVSAFVLCQVLDILFPASLTVSLAGIRDGIIYDHLH